MSRDFVAVCVPASCRSFNRRMLRLILLLQLLTNVVTLTNATPISAPDSLSKVAKNIGSTSSSSSSPSSSLSSSSSSSSAAYIIKPSAHDVQLNSLNAYAINYGHLAAENSKNNNNNNHNQVAQTDNTNSIFKPSYKLPGEVFIENNFTPIQTPNSGGINIMPQAAPLTAAAPNINTNNQNNNNNIPQPTPVLMQYFPQPVHEAGVHYLQLIPTRPLIVPISPYLNGGNAAPPSAATQVGGAQQAALHPPLAGAINSGGAPSILTTDTLNSNALHQQQQQQHQHQQHQNQQHQHQQHQNQQHQHPQPHQISPLSPTLVELSHAAATAAAAHPYGLHTYANAIQPYRSNGYRINREVKSKHYPIQLASGTMSLNMNEYIPGPNEVLRPLFMRGRP